ncbi:MAG: lipid A deacylase LpxR family protein [Hydrogenovibrio sp.]
MFSCTLTAADLSVQLDNDILYGTDREYTGGFIVRWTDATGIGLVDGWASPLERLALSSDALQGVQKTDQLGLAMQIFTLEKHGDTRHDSAGNSGWAHIDLRRFYQYGRYQSVLGLRLGWLGPSSGGQEIQNGLHSIIGNDNASGWDHQVPDQPTLQVAFDQQVFLSEPQSHSGGQLYGALSVVAGSPETAVSFGVGAYYADGARPVMRMNALDHVVDMGSGLGWFVFADVSAKYDIYNVFLDGRPFTEDDPNIEFANVVIPAAQYGGGLSFNHFYVVLSSSVLGQVYRGQPENHFKFASLYFGMPF